MIVSERKIIFRGVVGVVTRSLVTFLDLIKTASAVMASFERNLLIKSSLLSRIFLIPFPGSLVLKRLVNDRLILLMEI